MEAAYGDTWKKCRHSLHALQPVLSGLKGLSRDWEKPVQRLHWSTAILFVIYLGYLLLRSVVEDPERAAAYAAVLGILGALDIPIIHFSVEWWRTLHQPATVLKPQAPSMDPVMYRALLVNVAAFLATFAYLAMRRYRLLTMRAEALARAMRAL